MSRVRLVALCLLAVGCASSERNDGAAIGEPCTDGDQCASGLCIFTGEGGLCTGPCTEGCPAEWSCFGVRDIAEPGTITEVCVPESPQLCTRCEVDSDCSVTGEDLCLTDDLGKKFCGRDCSAVSCPDGFTCQEFPNGGSVAEQCVPVSQACDCGDAEANSTEMCTIETFAGDCVGVRTCQGGIGWSECEPPSDVDVPDEAFFDDNCDGIDGDLDNSILVAKDGEDVSDCGLSTDAPCATINFAIGVAAAAGRAHVLVQRGLYIESVRLADGVSVWGGYSFGWRRGPHTDDNHRVEILGAADETTGEFATIIAEDIAAATTVGDVVLTGASASGQIGASGRSSYVVYTKNATALRFERIHIEAGSGADGVNGTNGGNAPLVSRTSVMNGKPGGPSDEFATTCNDSSRGARGAPKGDNTCGGGRDPDGGVGGRGGTMDSSCSFGFCAGSSCTATAGESGSSADMTIGTSGLGGSGGSGGGSCGVAGRGLDGFVANGARGIGASSGGFLSANFWRTRSGSAGGVGAHGTGGGGGGGSGGCDVGTDSYGAGGGSGGAGGCAALGGGGGGSGGGASFGILAIDSEIEIAGCVLIRGNGGDGGNGGVGGRGQSGGIGGAGGASTNDSAPGGRGGDGAHGGHGGGGGGGSGGHSIAIGNHDSTVIHDCDVSGGAGGAKGTGGPSAPSAPAAERDGRAGSDGQPGGVFGVLIIP